MNSTKMTLSNGPLTAVLIQLKFSPIMQIAEYIPKVQDLLRRKDFPLFDVLQGENFQTGPHGEIKTEKLEQWVFSSNDYSENILIDKDTITYQITDCSGYDYQAFIGKFIEAVNSLDSIVDISAITRLGLRYINAIPEKENLSWKEVLHEHFHGMQFPESVSWSDNALFAYSTQRGVQIESIKMLSNFQLRIMQNLNGYKYPQDIIKFPLGAPEVFQDINLVTFVDIDHYILLKAAKKHEVIEQLDSIFGELHAAIEEVFFTSVISEKAKEVWK